MRTTCRIGWHTAGVAWGRKVSFEPSFREDPPLESAACPSTSLLAPRVFAKGARGGKSHFWPTIGTR